MTALRNLELGVDAGAVAGPVGWQVSAGANVTFDAPIYSYSRNQGVFAGASLDGSVIQVNDSANHDVYGDDVTGTDILIRIRRTVPERDVTKPFTGALERHAGR